MFMVVNRWCKIVFFYFICKMKIITNCIFSVTFDKKLGI